MKVQTKIQKWGNGLAIRITGVMREVPHFEEGMPIEVSVFANKLEIKKAKTKVEKFQFPYTEHELIQGLNSNTAHTELLVNNLLKDEF